MRSTVLIIVALGCGLVASLGVYQYLRAASKQDEARAVLVATKEININEPLTKENVRIAQWPSRQIPQGSLAELKQVESKYARVRLYEGEPILGAKVMNWDDASSSLKVPKGFRAVSVKVTMEASVSSLIEPGDHVDVIVVMKRSPETPPMAKTILKAVQVFAVNSEIAKSPDKDKSLAEIRTVSLLLDPEQAEKLAMGQDLGIVRLALRSPGDDTVDETRGCTMERLLGRGDVVGSESQSQDEAERREEEPAVSEEEVAANSSPSEWSIVIDSPKRTEEYSCDLSGKPPRLAAVKDKTKAPSSLSAPASDAQEPRDVTASPKNTTAVQASWRHAAPSLP